MKKILNILAIAGLCLGVVLMAACPSAFRPVSSGGNPVSAGKGAISLSIAGSAARTVFPDELENFTYIAAFTTTDAVEEDEIVVPLSNGRVTVELEPATWDIFIQATFGGNLVGKAEIPGVTLAEDETKQFNSILIQPFATGPKGTFVWTLEYPAETDSVIICIDDDEIDLLNDDLSDYDIVFADPKYSIELEPGAYLFCAQLECNSIEAGMAEIIHIYPGLQTSIDWKFYQKFDITVTQPGSNGTIAVDKAEAMTGVVVTVIPNPDPGYKLVNLKVSKDGDPDTTVAVTGLTFIMPSFDVVITGEFWPLKLMYKIYSDGVVNAGFTPAGWETNIDPTSTEGGGHSGTSAIAIPRGWGQWGWGMGINAASTSAVDFRTVDALSFWAKASEEMTVDAFGLLDDAGSGNDAYNVEYKGEAGTGVTVGTSWQRIIVPIPNPANAPARLQVLKFWIGNTQTATLYIDDIELIADTGKSVGISIPSTGSCSPNAVVAISSLVNNFKLEYTIDGTVASMFHGSTHKTNTNQWYTPTYSVVGASVAGNNITAPAMGSFTISVTALGIASNDRTVTIQLPSSTIIDDMSLAQSGITNVGGGWWAGHAGTGPGGAVAALVSAQCGGGGALSIARTNASIDYINDITPFVATHPTVSLKLYSRGGGAIPSNDRLSFELRTGAGGSVTWISQEFSITRDRNATSGTPTDIEGSDWTTVKIPLSNFWNGYENPITSLSNIAITGWRINAPVGNINLWITDIKLIEEVILDWPTRNTKPVEGFETAGSFTDCGATAATHNSVTGWFIFANNAAATAACSFDADIRPGSAGTKSGKMSFNLGTGAGRVIRFGYRGYTTFDASDASGTIRISFWAKASIAGTYQVITRNSDNNDRTGNFAISAADTWQQITIAVPGNSNQRNNINYVSFAALGANIGDSATGSLLIDDVIIW